MYHNIVLAGNKTYYALYEYKHGVLIRFDLKTIFDLLFSGHELHFRLATQEEMMDLANQEK